MRLILIALLVMVIFFFGRAVHLSNNPDMQLAGSKPEQSTQNYNVDESLWSFSSWTPITVFTCVLAVSTLGLLGYTFQLWRTTERAVQDGRESTKAALRHVKESARAADEMAKAADAMSKQATIIHQTYLASHRPLLVIHSIQVLPFDEKRIPDDQEIWVEFAVVNAGTGQCKMVTGSAVYLEYLYPADRPRLPSLTRRDVIPLRPFDVGATDNSIRISSDEWGGLNHVHPTEKILYLHGWITYDEHSGATRTTYFRRIYSRETERFSPSTDPDDETTY